MRPVLKIFMVALSLLAAAISLPAMAQQSLAEAKAQGIVGERADGLVGIVVDSPSSAVRQMVNRINDERLAEYRRVAEDTDAPLEAVQARAGRQLIGRLDSGEYFTDAAGRWRQK